MAVLNYDDDAVEPLLTDPHTMLGLSDAGAHASQLCDSCFSTHLLSHWVRDRAALTLEEAVRKLTSEPAAVFGITDRGTLAAGTPADVVVFDADTVGCSDLRRVADQPAGAERLVADATGIDAVIVNGTVIRRDGADVVTADGPCPGRLLRNGIGMTARPHDGTTAPKTKWGDREGRRRDILDAGAGPDGAGWLPRANMREIARGAGVSPGTLYQYFSTKEEIFATLYAEAITAHNERIDADLRGRPRPRGVPRRVALAYLDLYAAYGRYFTMWRAVIDAGSAVSTRSPASWAAPCAPRRSSRPTSSGRRSAGSPAGRRRGPRLADRADRGHLPLDGPERPRRPRHQRTAPPHPVRPPTSWSGSPPAPSPPASPPPPDPRPSQDPLNAAMDGLMGG